MLAIYGFITIVIFLVSDNHKTLISNNRIGSGTGYICFHRGFSFAANRYNVFGRHKTGGANRHFINVCGVVFFGNAGCRLV